MKEPGGSSNSSHQAYHKHPNNMVYPTTTTNCSLQTKDDSRDSSLSEFGVPTAVQSLSFSVSSSSSTSDEHKKTKELPVELPTSNHLRAGRVSPNKVCRQRRHSHALVTDLNVNHPLLEGRRKIIVPVDLLQLTTAAETSCLSHCQASDHDREYSSTVPNMAELVHLPSPLRPTAWAEADAESYEVRSRHYLTDGVKSPSQPSVFKLWTIDLVKAQNPLFTGLCAHPNERIQRALRHEKETGTRVLPDFILAVNMLIPTSKSYCYHFVAYFGVDDRSVLESPDTPLGRVAQPFFFGPSDAFRDETFKLIPRIMEGNYLVKKAVGSKPTMLGSRLKQRYIQSSRYLEVVVDIGSNPLAQSIVKLVLGCAKSLVIEMMFVLEGKHTDTLPERILGGVQLRNLDFNNQDGQRTVPT